MNDEIVSAILIKKTIKDLENTVKKLNKENNKIQKAILYLTIITLILSALQFF